MRLRLRVRAVRRRRRDQLLLGRERARADFAQVVLQQLEADIQVAALAGGARQLPEDPERSLDPFPLRPLGQEGQGHAQAAPRHAHLVNGLLVACQAFRELLEHGAHPLAEQR